ncbi:MAG TPA: glycosyltransferase family 1 protein [Vicinamibacterales bacterium]
MRLAFNLTAAIPGSSGFVHATELLRAMVRIAGTHQLIAVTLREQEPLRDALPADVEQVVIDGAPRQALQRTAWLQWRLPALVRDADADLLFNKGNFHLFRGGVRQVCMLENANPFSRLDLPQPMGMRIRNRLLRVMSASALRHAAGLVFPSDTARRRILAQIPTRAATTVVPYGWRPADPEPIETRPEPPYILVVTSLYPHRNLPLAVQALAHLHARGTFRGRLVMVGGGPADYGRWLAKLVASSPVAAHVHVLPPMTTGQLATLYGSAAVALMPSLEETFGIPVLEAMGYGVPLVASRIADADASRYFLPFEEIAGDAAEYFDPRDAASCADAIERALRDERRRELVCAGRARAAGYGWMSVAQRTLGFLESVGPRG